jgi:cobyrinic acid a,c-diamide synthase
MFKAGPDYLDPTYHAMAAGRTSHTLDGWMMGREAVLRTFRSAAAECDIALIEGVMGLFDGASATSEEGSTAEIAKWLRAPVMAVVDASGMARTVAAVAQGLATFDPGLRLAGIVCNRVGSKGHLELLRQASTSVPVLGGLPQERSLGFPERHLGLHAADHLAIDDAVFEEWGRRVAEWFDLKRILQAANGAGDLPEVDRSRDAASDRSIKTVCRIGVARDAAFHFYYEDNLRRLREAGAELIYFSPVGDAHLPDLDGLYFGGGYPELHAGALAANEALRREITAFAAAGKPIYAECGGLMYLSSAIRTLDGVAHPMVGLIAGETVMCERLQALGYAEVETSERSILGPAGLRFRGHQFRYSELRGVPESVERVYDVRRPRNEERLREGYHAGNVLASYVHAHWASCAVAAAGFVASCLEVKKKNLHSTRASVRQ